MSMTRSLLKRRMELRVIGGQNLFPWRPGSKYIMRRTFSRGVVRIGFKKFYFLGFGHNAAGERNVGKAAAGAVVGGLLTGGVGGLIVGGAVGGIKKNTSTATLLFATFDTQQQFSVTVNCDAYLHQRLSRVRVATMPALMPT